MFNNISCYSTSFSYTSLQMSVSEIDFREFYTSAGDLKDDENRDHYPPRFITQLNGDQHSALHLEYTLHVIKDDKIIKDYKFSISRSVPKAYKGNKVYNCEFTSF